MASSSNLESFMNVFSLLNRRSNDSSDRKHGNRCQRVLPNQKQQQQQQQQRQQIKPKLNVENRYQPQQQQHRPRSQVNSATNEASQWRTAICPKTQKTYYWNVQTRESRWKKPIEMATPQERLEIETKERQQRCFFEEMERNILQRLKVGGGSAITAFGAPLIGNQEHGSKTMPSSSANSSATNDFVGLSSIEDLDVSLSDDSSMKIQESWVQAWLTASTSTLSLSSSSSTSSTSTTSIKTLNSRNINREKDDKVAPLSNLRFSSSTNIGSLQSSSDCSNAERKKSTFKMPVIDKPKFIRTISKMEYDFALLLRGDVSVSNTFGVDGSRSVTTEVTPLTSYNMSLTPSTFPADDDCTSVSIDFLSSLHITHEDEGIGCTLVEGEYPSYLVEARQIPSSPLTHASDASYSGDVGNRMPFSPSSPSPCRSFNYDIGIVTPNESMRSDLVKPSFEKRNTCGTLYLGSTLSAPDKDALIKCVCGVFRAHLLQSDTISTSTSKAFEVFNDDYKLNIGSTSKQSENNPDRLIPSLEDITCYYRDIFLRSQMEIDCIIISLIYIERLIKKTNGQLHPTISNWKSLLFSCMVLSSKVWDDLSMWNCDFSKIGPMGVVFTLQRTNELELALLSALDYHVKVNASEYAKYYFLLRSMLCRSGLANDSLTMMNPLNAMGMKNLREKTSALHELAVSKTRIVTRSKSFNDAVNERSDARFHEAIDELPKNQKSKKVSLEHLVRM